MPANPDFDDIATTTVRNRSGKIADNASRTTAFLDRLRKKGKMRPVMGGRTIVQELEVSLNPNSGWYAGLDNLSTNAHEPFSAAEYDWKQAYTPIVWSGLDEIRNQGEWAATDLIASRIANGERSLNDLVAIAVHSDGTGSGGKQLHGLGLFVVTAPTTGTVGGIDRAANSFWRNQTATATFAAVNIAATHPSAFMQGLNSLSIATVRGKDRPDLYLGDSIGYQRFLESMQPLQRITNVEMAAAGFTQLKYNGVGGDADFVLENVLQTSNRVFAINTDYIYLRVHPNRNFKPIGGVRTPINQDGKVQFIGFAGNLCLSNAGRQGVLSNV